MSLQIKVIFVVTMLALCLAPTALAANGRAVFYQPMGDGYYHPSACYGNRRFRGMVAGVKGTLWHAGRACGKRYRVTCSGSANAAPNPCKRGKSVVVTVVDLCREKCNGDLNLSKDAFAKIADLRAGVVRIRYTQV